MNTFRRPASLSPAQQDELPGESDPAEHAELAHSTAAALLDGGRNTTDPDVVSRLVNLVRNEGIEEIADLWSTAPANTLPGTLWRLYVLHLWTRQDPGVISDRYDRGRHTAPALQLLAGVAAPPGPDEIKHTLDDILSGIYTGDFSVALQRAAAFCRLVAFGTGNTAAEISNLDNIGAESLTKKGGALLRTADELDDSSALWQIGKLN